MKKYYVLKGLFSDDEWKFDVKLIKKLVNGVVKN